MSREAFLVELSCCLHDDNVFCGELIRVDLVDGNKSKPYRFEVLPVLAGVVFVWLATPLVSIL